MSLREASLGFSETFTDCNSFGNNFKDLSFDMCIKYMEASGQKASDHFTALNEEKPNILDQIPSIEEPISYKGSR